MEFDLKSAMAANAEAVEQVLDKLLKPGDGPEHRVIDAMRYSSLGGGKRVRPFLVTASAALFGVDKKAALRAAAAVEMVHCYSLIHDDLPAMDDDVLRRGRPTCHVAFDEATAILAGDGLQALAFGVLADVGPRAAELVALAAAAAGPAGMVGGQQLDLDAEGAEVDAAQVAAIHRGKTAAMISLSLAAGGVCRGATPDTVRRLVDAGRWLGLAFQGADDVLDVVADSATLGKTVGKDEAAGKATWVRVEGLEAASARARRYGKRGRKALQEVLADGPAAGRLLALADYMWQRDH